MDLSVVVVNHNAKEELELCLKSLMLQRKDLSFEILVADNNSSDGSLGMLQTEFPMVHLTELDANVGFSKANNACWRQAQGELVLFLNSDTMVPPSGLRKMTAVMNARSEVGGLGPLLRNTNGSIQLSFGSALSITSELKQKIIDKGYGNGQGPLKNYVNGLYAIERNVDWVSGACLLVRKHILEKVDGFDERFFLYSEDVDLCGRIRAEGFSIIFHPDVEVLHHRGRSVVKMKEKAIFESQRSRLCYYKKHYGHPRLSALVLYMLFRSSISCLFNSDLSSAHRQLLRLLIHKAQGKS